MTPLENLLSYTGAPHSEEDVKAQLRIRAKEQADFFNQRDGAAYLSQIEAWRINAERNFQNKLPQPLKPYPPLVAKAQDINVIYGPEYLFPVEPNYTPALPLSEDSPVVGVHLHGDFYQFIRGTGWPLDTPFIEARGIFVRVTFPFGSWWKKIG